MLAERLPVNFVTKIKEGFMSLPSHPNTYYAALAIVAAAHVVDVITTQTFLNQGLSEPSRFAGPLIEHYGITSAIPLKSAAFGLTMALCDFVRRNTPEDYSYRVPILGLRLHGGITAAVAGLNLFSNIPPF